MADLVLDWGALGAYGTFLTDTDSPAAAEVSEQPVATEAPPAPIMPVADEEADPETLRIPYEKNNRTFFAAPDQIAAIRAEGHYTILYVRDEKLFCPWPISQLVKRMHNEAFLQVHRSYLINPAHVSSFERKKDNGVCYFDAHQSLDKVPVSRSRLSEVRDALGLT